MGGGGNDPGELWRKESGDDGDEEGDIGSRLEW